MSDKKLLDSILPPLADDFETHKPNSAGVEIMPEPGEWEFLRELFGGQFAEGLMLYSGQGKPSWVVKLTPKGYTVYRSRIAALRAFTVPEAS